MFFLLLINETNLSISLKLLRKPNWVQTDTAESGVLMMYFWLKYIFICDQVAVFLWILCRKWRWIFFFLSVRITQWRLFTFLQQRVGKTSELVQTSLRSHEGRIQTAWLSRNQKGWRPFDCEDTSKEQTVLCFKRPCRVLRLTFDPITFLKLLVSCILHPIWPSSCSRQGFGPGQVPPLQLSHPVPASRSSDPTSPAPSFNKHSLSVSSLRPFLGSFWPPAQSSAFIVQTVPQHQRLCTICSSGVNWVPTDEGFFFCDHSDLSKDQDAVRAKVTTQVSLRRLQVTSFY